MYVKPVFLQLGNVYDIKGARWMNYDFGNDMRDQYYPPFSSK